MIENNPKLRNDDSIDHSYWMSIFYTELKAAMKILMITFECMIISFIEYFEEGIPTL
jgi:hypothetical protein